MTDSRLYNAADDLLGRNLSAGRGNKVAYIDDSVDAGGRTTFAQLADRAGRLANALAKLDLRPEERVFLCLLDTIDFPTVFLGAIKAGVIPVAANTLLTTKDYDYMLRDCRARVLFVSAQLWPTLAPIVATIPTLKKVVISGGSVDDLPTVAALLAESKPEHTTAATTRDDACFWLYSSGSTGAPKGTVHAHSSMIQTADLYARPVLGIAETDVVFSAAKLFFAYGLGNALSFPLAVGATTVLMPERPTPAAVFKRLREHGVTLFYGVPTLYAALLVSPELPKRGELKLRLCTSAGEALPEDLARRWNDRFGIEILDGLGSTEMLHIFISNRPGDVRYNSTGRAVPGYDVRVVDDKGVPVKAGEVGEMQVSGPTAALLYWNQREKTRNTFQGPWTRSGDKYTQTADGYFIYAGRSDDMLKVGGIYVSPVEVEQALVNHPAVLEAAVVGREDEEKLVKPVAYVVLKPGVNRSESLVAELQQHVKSQLAPYKYPRWIEFIDELPKTATGKIQRFRLRGGR